MVTSLILNLQLPTHRLYPLALVSMIAAVVVEVHDPLGLIQQMFVFILTVLIGLFCHAVFVLPASYLVVVRRNPYRHLLRCGKALVTAFVTNNRYHAQLQSLHFIIFQIIQRALRVNVSERVDMMH